MKGVVFVLTLGWITALGGFVKLANMRDKEFKRLSELEEENSRLKQELESLRREKKSQPGRCSICRRFVPAGKTICERCANRING